MSVSNRACIRLQKGASSPKWWVLHLLALELEDLDHSCRVGTEGSIGTTVCPACDVFCFAFRDVRKQCPLGYRMPKLTDLNVSDQIWKHYSPHAVTAYTVLFAGCISHVEEEGRGREGSGVSRLPQITLYKGSIWEHTLITYVIRKAIHQLYGGTYPSSKLSQRLSCPLNPTVLQFLVTFVFWEVYRVEGYYPCLRRDQTETIPLAGLLSLPGQALQVRECTAFDSVIVAVLEEQHA